MIMGNYDSSYPVRYGYNVLVWQIAYKKNGFKYYLYVQGTEPAVREYMESEMGYMGSYTALTDEEVKMVKTLRCPIYEAPDDRWMFNYRGENR